MYYNMKCEFDREYNCICEKGTYEFVFIDTINIVFYFNISNVRI